MFFFLKFLTYNNMKTNKMKITKEQILKMQKAAGRNADIELGVPHFKHKVHKTAKDYTRKPKHRKDVEEG